MERPVSPLIAVACKANALADTVQAAIDHAEIIRRDRALRQQCSTLRGWLDVNRWTEWTADDAARVLEGRRSRHPEYTAEWLCETLAGTALDGTDEMAELLTRLAMQRSE